MGGRERGGGALRVALSASVRTSHDVSIHTIHFSVIISGCEADVSTKPQPFSLPGTGPMTQRGAPP